MHVPDQQIPRRSKYARVERERRFLLAELPAEPAMRTRRVTDRYFPSTRLRLRMLQEDTPDGPVLDFKLAQKTPDGFITNTYLTRAEYDLLASLPGDDLAKTRHSIPPFGVDVFEGPLAGLVLAEAEFATDQAMAAFRPSIGIVAEVTDDVRFTGAKLVHTTAAQLTELL